MARDCGNQANIHRQTNCSTWWHASLPQRFFPRLSSSLTHTKSTLTQTDIFPRLYCLDYLQVEDTFIYSLVFVHCAYCQNDLAMALWAVSITLCWPVVRVCRFRFEAPLSGQVCPLSLLQCPLRNLSNRIGNPLVAHLFWWLSLPTSH